MKRGWWGLPCFNALSAEQQVFLVTEGYLPIGWQAEGDECAEGAEVEVTTMWDEYPGPRFYCRECAVKFLSELEVVSQDERHSGVGRDA